MTALRHQILDDDRVLVVATGDTPQHFRITVAEAKRFAWSLLADLDIDGAVEAGYVVEAPSLVSRAREEKDRSGWGTQMDAIADVLASVEEASTTQIACSIGVNRQQVAVQMCRMRDRGHAVCVQTGTAGIPAVWKRGPVGLREWRLRKVKRLVAA